MRQPGSSWSIAAIALITTAVLIAVVYSLLRPDSPARGPAGDATGGEPLPGQGVRIRWVEGATEQYDALVSTTVRVGRGGRDSIVRQTLSGRLNLRVLSVKGTAAMVALQLSGLELKGDSWTEDAEMALSRPFISAFAEDGAVREVLFPPDISVLACRQLEEFIRTFQVVVPADAGATWTVEEAHASGRYVARYERRDSLEIVKSKMEYLSPLDIAPLALGVRIEHSLVRARLREQGSWVDRVIVEDDIAQSMGARMTVASTLRGKLERRLESTPAELEIHGDARELIARVRVRADAEDMSGMIAEPAVSPRGEPGEREFRRVEEVVTSFDESAGRNRSVLFELRRLLREYPSLAEFILDLIDAPTLSQRTVAELIHTLERAGTPEAQSVLSRILEDGTRDRQNRLRAAIALGGTTSPTEECVEALWGVYAQSLPDSGSDVPDTAALSLGRAGRSLRASDPARYEALKSQLLGRLSSVSADAEKGILLTSLGNTADPAIAPDVEPYLRSESPRLRAAAASALGSLGSTDSLPALTARLGEEPDGGVRAAIADSLLLMDAADPERLSAVNELVGGETDAQARFAMVRYLAENLAAFPASRENLHKIMVTDASQRVRAYLAPKLLDSSGE
ncbi:MAG: HEAT repeat domain-containing protein [Planctomycetes bacterium]|nr:HEAT repeat domain-containing protein [Planctomycetota bacterium]